MLAVRVRARGCIRFSSFASSGWCIIGRDGLCIGYYMAYLAGQILRVVGS